MLSRVADSMYWMSRYLERAEHTARLLDVTQHTLLDMRAPRLDADAHWRRLLQATGDGEQFERFRPGAPLAEVASFMTLDMQNQNSIVSCVSSARENARQIREQISSEMWAQVNSLFLQLRAPQFQQRWHDEPHAFYQAVKMGSHLFQGITDATLAHSEGWQFIQVGRFLERAVQTARLLSLYTGKLSEALASDTLASTLEWVGLLKSCSGFEAYTKVYRASIRPHQVAEFLLLHPRFPRSVRFCASMVQAALQAIGDDAAHPSAATRAERLAGRLRAQLDYAQIDELIAAGIQGFLESVQQQCHQIDVQMHRAYISYPIESALIG